MHKLYFLLSMVSLHEKLFLPFLKTVVGWGEKVSGRIADDYRPNC
jgi:hypothetical protein